MTTPATPTPKANPILPPRLREYSFRRYEDVIAIAVKNYPKITSFDPSPLSPVTFSCRLRDAMSSLYLYEWPTTKIDITQFRQIYPYLAVSESHDGTIATGGAEHIRQFRKGTIAAKHKAVITQPATAEHIPQPLTVKDFQVLNSSELTTLCRLAEQRLLVCSINVSATPDEVTQLSNKYDVIFEPTNNENEYTLF